MQKIILILLVIFVNLASAQKKSVSVEYGVKILDESATFKNNSGLRSMMDEAIGNSGSLSFVLVIQNNVSKFYDNSGLSNVGENSISSAVIFSGYSGVVHNFNGNIYRESRSLPKNTLLKELYKSNWVLVNETKLIDNYLCYKATNINIVDNGQGKIFNHPVIAWYCPALPYNFGPNGYGNLPGLILELQVRNVNFGAKKIDLNSNIDLDVEFLKTVKTISVEEHNQILQHAAENFKD